jgi:hypothetical protein
MKPRPVWRWAPVIVGLVAIPVAWLAGGILGLIVVLVAELLVVSYRWRRHAAGWRSGRPTIERGLGVERAIATKLPERVRPELDPVEGWIRERTLYDLFDDQGDSSPASADDGA